MGDTDERCGANFIFSHSDEMKNAWSYISTPPPNTPSWRGRGAQLNLTIVLTFMDMLALYSRAMHDGQNHGIHE
jgi:hypothetical protein